MCGQIKQDQELIARQKTNIEELETQSSGRSQQLDISRQDYDYMSGFSDRQSQILAKQREEIASLTAALEVRVPHVLC